MLLNYEASVQMSRVSHCVLEYTYFLEKIGELISAKLSIDM